MNKKDTQRENILRHGLTLKRIFGLENVGPATLCKQLHRIEACAHRLAEQECNGEIEIDDTRDEKILFAVDRILGFREKHIPVFFNGDPRGYALKICDAWMREHPEAADLYRDWGGYGIICPEF